MKCVSESFLKPRNYHLLRTKRILQRNKLSIHVFFYKKVVYKKVGLKLIDFQ